MQVLCMATADLHCDVQCPFCDQKYTIYYSRQSKTECDEARASVLTALAAHHADNPSMSAHPADGFTVPAWNGPLHTCAAALLSGARLKAATPPRKPLPVAPSPIALVPPNTQQQRRVS